MAEISTNIILDGITLALRKAYPESAIYCKAVKQGLRPPAFIALLATAGQEAQPSKRWKRSVRFDVLYFPEAGREECYATADELCQILDVITLPTGDLLRGSDVSCEVVDGMLHFFISYNHFAYALQEENAMETLQSEQEG